MSEHSSDVWLKVAAPLTGVKRGILGAVRSVEKLSSYLCWSVDLEHVEGDFSAAGGRGGRVVLLVVPGVELDRNALPLLRHREFHGVGPDLLAARGVERAGHGDLGTVLGDVVAQRLIQPDAADDRVGGGDLAAARPGRAAELGLALHGDAERGALDAQHDERRGAVSGVLEEAVDLADGDVFAAGRELFELEGRVQGVVALA